MNERLEELGSCITRKFSWTEMETQAKVLRQAAVLHGRKPRGRMRRFEEVRVVVPRDPGSRVKVPKTEVDSEQGG